MKLRVAGVSAYQSLAFRVREHDFKRRQHSLAVAYPQSAPHTVPRYAVPGSTPITTPHRQFQNERAWSRVWRYEVPVRFVETQRCGRLKGRLSLRLRLRYLGALQSELHWFSARHLSTIPSIRTRQHTTCAHAEREREHSSPDLTLAQATLVVASRARSGPGIAQRARRND
eukprot:3403535-Rhodomonas_salina.6